ncbi:MAG: YdeI/OmpD-associated family protein [Bacteroidota bacterium]
MPEFTFETTVQQLEKRKGGYFYLKIDASIVNQFERKRATRLICTIDGKLSYQCGLNHFGDGHFFIIIATRYIKQLKKQLGDKITFFLEEDPNPLGVEVPEVLEVLLEQDEEAKASYEKMTDGRKRSLIHAMTRIKNIDKQVELALKFLAEQRAKSR